MKLHRFYAGDLHDKYGQIELRQHVWINQPELYNQWVRVLRFKVGDELVLFNGKDEDRLYRVEKIEDTSVGLDLITELEPVHPKREVYLFWSLLKKDKNEWVLQKCTEIGVTHFVPIFSDRTEKTGFDEDRATKIVIEASEQCGRSDIPRVREPIGLRAAIEEFKDKIALYFAEQTEASEPLTASEQPLGVFVGPEGGWTEQEKDFLSSHCKKLNIAQFTLRAETAAVTASTLLLQ
jgi:16S rRNA (uracil1498-N3)-methyltransferase